MQRKKLLKSADKKRLDDARKIKEPEKLTSQDVSDWRKLNYAKLRMNR